MVTLIEGLIVMIGVHIQEKQKTGDNLMFLKITNQFQWEGGRGEAFQSSTNSPLGSGPAMTCKFRHKGKK